MPTDITVNEKKYIICYDVNTPVLHYVVLEPERLLSTGQPEVEVFDTEDEVIARMIELGFNPDDYITKYKFLSFNTEDDCWDDIDKINKCLGENYIERPLMMKDNTDYSFLGYVILIDDKISPCLTMSQQGHIMLSSSSEVTII